MTAAARPSVLIIGAEPAITRACMELGVDLVVVYGPSVRDADALDVPEQVRTVFVQDQRFLAILADEETSQMYSKGRGSSTAPGAEQG